MTTDPIEPREPDEPREPGEARRPRKPGDPFERAARLEEQEELRREVTRARLLRSVTGKDSDMGSAIAALGFPYLVWGLIRAAFYDFGSPLPQSIVGFLFDDFWWFGAYTVVVLLLIWAALITRFQNEDD